MVADENVAQDNAEPALELYASQRVKWVSPISGAGQKKGMPDSADV